MPDVMPTSSTIALTTTRQELAAVTGPEDLPPSVARQMAEIVATYRMTGADAARDLLRLGATTAVVAAIALLLVSPASAVGAMFGFFMAVPMVLKKAPLTRVQQHLREIGIGWKARRRLMTKLAAIVGSLPARDPADRPAVDEIVALLAPGGVDPWAPSSVPGAPRVLVTTDSVDITLARSVVGHILDRRQRERTVLVTIGAVGVGTVGLLLSRGAPLWIAAMMGLVLLTSYGIGVALGRVLSRRLLGRMVATLGVDVVERDRLLAALKPLLSRKALSTIPKDRQREVLAARLVEAVSSPAALPAMPVTSDG